MNRTLPENNKSESFERVMATTLALIANRGLEQVNVSTVARLSKISRTWIYKYVGPSKENLIRDATLYIGKIFSELDARPKPTNKTELTEALRWGNRQLIENVKRYPWIPTLFFKYGPAKNHLGETIREVQNTYIKVLAAELKATLPITQEASLRFAGIYTSMRMGAMFWWMATLGDLVRTESSSGEFPLESFVLERLEGSIAQIDALV